MLSMCLVFFSSPLKGSDNYFPLSIGNTWYYKYAEIDSIDYLPDLVFDIIKINNTTYYEFGSNKEYPYIIRSDSLGRIWRRTDDKENIWFDFTLPDSGFYVYRPFHDDQPYVVQVRRNITIKTFAGVFLNCIEFFFDDTTSFDDEQWYTFAPNIGIVRKQYAWNIFLLSSAIIDSQIITAIESIPKSPVNSWMHIFPNPSLPF